MENQPKRKRACVLIVDHDLEYGIKLADWLATHGYQAVLVRSAEAVLDECLELRPQTVFIRLSRSEPFTLTTPQNLLRAIGAACPDISVITMGHQAVGSPMQITTDGNIRHILVHPLEHRHIGRLLQAELNRSRPLLTLPDTSSDPPYAGVIEPCAPARMIRREVSPWIA